LAGITPQQVYQQRAPLKLAQELERLLDPPADYGEPQPFAYTILGPFAEGFMGFTFIEKVPKWLLAGRLELTWHDYVLAASVVVGFVYNYTIREHGCATHALYAPIPFLSVPERVATWH
jgi:hypothetical protein